MNTLQIVLMFIGAVFALLIFFVTGTFGADIWDASPISIRYRLYDFLMIRHKWLTVISLLFYLAFVVIAFKKEVRQAFSIEESVSEFHVRIVAYVALLLVLVGLTLWSFFSGRS